ncbi:helix-turn-helix domain-containing protein [Grimontia hollisae]|uniref:helix-turn-helix domain-containing protein n=1 Tax=Grimontia hollisae TaxID=673 RepID=UPI00165D3CE5|nr:helix-turn-helix domain-containing protein [Grimontia hollisae]
MLLRLKPSTLGLRNSERLLLAQLSAHMNPSNDWSCWPSFNTLADEMEVSVSTVTRNMKGVVNSGLITVQRGKKKDGSNANNIYRFNRDKFAELTGLEIETPEQLLAGAESAVHTNTLKKVYAAFVANEPLTQAQAILLLDGKPDLSAVERMQIERFL